MKTAVHIIGRTRSGKTRKLMEVCRTIIKRRNPLIVIDGKGELYDDVLRYATYTRVRPERLTLVDPTSNHVPGINPLQPQNGEHPSALADHVVNFFLKFFGEEEEAKIWVREYGPSVLTPLAASGLTLLETFYFIIDPAFRNSILSRLEDYPYIAEKWEFFRTNYKLFEQARILQPIQSRMDIFYRFPYLTAMFGQHTTINFKHIMAQDGVLLANLAPRTSVPPSMLSFIGASFLSAITLTARGRPYGSRPVYVVLDEFQRFLTSDIAETLDELAAHGLRFLLSHQRLSQLYSHDPDLLSAVMANARTKLVFNVYDEDAQLLYREIFAGMIYPKLQQPKDEIYRTLFKPVFTLFPITSHHKSEGQSDQYGESVGADDTQGEQESSAQCINPEDGTIINQTTGQNVSYAHKEAWASSWSTTKVKTEGSSTSLVPLYLLNEAKELSSRQYPTVEEIKEEYIGILNTLRQRHYILKRPDEPPQPMMTNEVKDIKVRPKDVDAFSNMSYAIHARPIKEVIREIQQRPNQFLLTHNNGDYNHDPDIPQPKRKR